MGLFPSRYRPKFVDNGRFRLLPLAVGSYQLREKEEEGEPGYLELLSFDDSDPSPMGRRSLGKASNEGVKPRLRSRGFEGCTGFSLRLRGDVSSPCASFLGRNIFSPRTREKKRLPLSITISSCSMCSKQVRAYAVSVLERADDEELKCYLLQLVQALRFERSDKSRLSHFLVQRSLSNIEIASFLRWYVAVELHDPAYAKRYY
ncbi:hypothetical protein BHM03_00042336, partial [Ensete ventricosum]